MTGCEGQKQDLREDKRDHLGSNLEAEESAEK